MSLAAGHPAAASTAPTESQLVERARGGDFDAFDALVNLSERRVFAVALRVVRQREDAENAVQNAFLRALENLDSFRAEASFATWVARIAFREALQILRARRGGEFSLDQATSEDGEGRIPHPELLADWRDDPSRLAETGELRGILDAAIDRLPEKLRVVFVLRDIEEWSTEETATELGLTVSNVKIRLMRARLALREALTQVFGDRDAALSHAHGHDSAGRENGR